MQQKVNGSTSFAIDNKIMYLGEVKFKTKD